MMRVSALSIRWRTTVDGVTRTFPPGLDMAGFEYLQAAEIRDAFARHNVRYLFLGKSGAINLGYPDTTKDADIFPEKTRENGRALVTGLRELGFALTDEEAAQIERGKDFVQLKNGPFDF